MGSCYGWVRQLLGVGCCKQLASDSYVKIIILCVQTIFLDVTQFPFLLHACDIR